MVFMDLALSETFHEAAMGGMNTEPDSYTDMTWNPQGYYRNLQVVYVCGYVCCAGVCFCIYVYTY